MCQELRVKNPYLTRCRLKGACWVGRGWFDLSAFSHFNILPTLATMVVIAPQDCWRKCELWRLQSPSQVVVFTFIGLFYWFPETTRLTWRQGGSRRFEEEWEVPSGAGGVKAVRSLERLSASSDTVRYVSARGPWDAAHVAVASLVGWSGR